MIQVQLSSLVLQDYYRKLSAVHEQICDGFDHHNIPILDIYADVKLSDHNTKLLFEIFPVHCDHFGSSDAFYTATRALNYFITTYKFFVDNRIDFTSFSLRSEDIIVITSFLIFKGI